MKVLLDIADDKAEVFLKILTQHAGIKPTPISKSDAVLFDEFSQIKKALKNAEKIKSGKLKGRPVEYIFGKL